MPSTTTVFRAPKGTFDLLPPRSEAVLAVREALAAPARLAGYRYVETPVFEDTALFERGVGESTDIVGKEMYTFPDKAGRSLTLRPEGTASVLRAALEAGLQRGQLPVKLWYSGSYFRYEQPQAGRYRHFSQVGAEALGVDDPALDAELVALAADGYRRLGLTGVRLLLNTLGDRACRPVYRAALQEFLAGLDLDADTRRRAEVNPLRVLDDKRPEVAAQLAGAPLARDFLCDACSAHFAAVQESLLALGVTWEDDPRLVRGLDYYTRTTFEFVHDGLGSQSAVGGGGRYDGLAESIGAAALPGIGWALGVDRTLLALEAEGRMPASSARLAVFAVPLSPAAKAALVPVVHALRGAGVATDLAYGDRGLKGSMKAADRSGAAWAVIAGDRDLAEGVVQLRDLASGEQTPVALGDVTTTLTEKLL